MPGIDYTLGMKNAGFNAGVSGALGKLADLGKKVALVTATAGLAVGVGFGALIGKSIEKAANIETLETAFAPLIGGAEAAKDRIAELAGFAAATPFELPEIAMASKVLETLTKGVLSTGKGLTLVGDIASAVDQPFNEIAVSVGRLYDGLDGGRPVGEAMARLQELGIISGDARAEIEAMQKAGLKGAEVWSVAEKAMGAFTGSMERQSGTWKGMMSTLGDAVSMTMAKFGEPIMDSLKPYLAGLTGQIEELETFAVSLGQSIATAFDVGMAAFQTGSIPQLIGDGLSLAMIDGINTFSSGVRGTLAFLQAAMKKIMGDVKDSWGLQELVGIFKNLGEGIAAVITTAIIKALDKLPGLDLGDDIRRSEADAKNKFNQAKNRVEDFDGGTAFNDLFTSLSDAVKVGRDAFAEAGKDPLLDRDGAAKRFAETMGPILDKIAENKSKADKLAKDLDDRLNSSRDGLGGGSGNPADKASKSGGGQTADRLAQIGGFVGGAARGLADRAAEKTAAGVSIISKLVSKIEQQGRSQPGYSGATF